MFFQEFIQHIESTYGDNMTFYYVKVKSGLKPDSDGK